MASLAVADPDYLNGTADLYDEFSQDFGIEHVRFMKKDVDTIFDNQAFGPNLGQKEKESENPILKSWHAYFDPDLHDYLEKSIDNL